MLGFDTETELIRPGQRAPKLVCVSWWLPDGSTGIAARQEAFDFVRWMLYQPKIICANAAFDFSVLIETFPELRPLIFQAYQEGRVFDPLMRQKLADIAQGTYRGTLKLNGGWIKKVYSLNECLQRHCGYALQKSDGYRYRFAELQDIPVNLWPHEARDYAMKDARGHYDAWKAQEEKYAHLGWLEDEAAQVRAHLALQLASCWGFRTDQEEVRRFTKATEERKHQIGKQLLQYGLLRPDWTKNTKRAKELMIEARGANCKLTETGYKKVMAGVLSKEEAFEKGYIALDEEACLASQNKLLELYADYSHLQKIEGTYLRHLINTPIVQTDFESLMETGRCSSKQPNLQQLPRAPGVRECYVARDGCVLLPCDYDKAELVSLAEICYRTVGFSKLGEALNAGLDPHCLVGGQIIGLDYETAFNRYKLKDPEMKNARQCGKSANFGLAGLLGPNGFVDFSKVQYHVSITLDQARTITQIWHRSLPEMKMYFDWVRGLFPLTRQGRQASRATIVQFDSNRRRGGCRMTQAANGFFQAMTADGAKAALWEVTRRQFVCPASSLYGSHVVNFVHDEIIPEVRETVMHEAAMELQNIMETEYNRFTRRVPVHTTAAATRRWYKDAEPVFDQTGRLIPWEPKEKAA